MNFRALCVLAALLASCLSSAGAAELQPRRVRPLAEDPAEARVIVQFKENAPTLRAHPLAQAVDKAGVAEVLQRRADALGARHGVALRAGRGILEHRQVVRAAGVDAATLARRLAADPDVAGAWVDQRRWRAAVPNDPLFAPAAGSSPASGQWYLKTPDATTPASIDAVSAWDASLGSSSMVVAVLDTGVRYDHPDLAGKLLPGRDLVSRDTVHESVLVANDGDGSDSDASDPGDWVTTTEVNDKNSPFYQCNSPEADGSYVGESSSWHGTLVSGLIGAATNNGVGMAGMLWNGKVLPVRVLGKCFGYDSDIQAGMLWAAGIHQTGEPDNTTPARVLNMSLGGDGACGSYQTIVNQVLAKGAVIVAAAGNGNGHMVGAPANCTGVIGVAGIRHVGTKVGYSDIGPEVSIAAPAGNCVNDAGPCLYPILSTTNTGTQSPVPGAGGATYTDAFDISVGTSFSTPLVAGTAALMLSANPSLTPTQVRSLIQSSARPFPTSGASTAGIGACQVPTSTSADQNECYCTTGTCGAGMLDSGVAVKNAASFANGLLAAIGVSPASPSVGNTVTLSSAATQVGSGHTITSYNWAVVSDGGIASISSASNASTATLATNAQGSVTVRLTVTDDAGNVSSVKTDIAVAAAATPNPTPSGSGSGGSSSGGGGGGAMSWPWLLALAAAVALLGPARRT